MSVVWVVEECFLAGFVERCFLLQVVMFVEQWPLFLVAVFVLVIGCLDCGGM